MINVNIRFYQSSDLDRCRALWAELVQRHREIYGDPSIGGAEPGLHFDQHLARAGAERIWIAESAGEVVGFVGLLLEDQDAEIEPIVVTANRRSQGVGRALLNCAMEEAGKLGVRYLNVRPVARNMEAIAFFYDSGFQTLGQIELFMDLRSPTPGKWQPGPTLYGCAFEF
jgi:N-acetylglutamate synthase-like GNAT family acetyltransferase